MCNFGFQELAASDVESFLIFQQTVVAMWQKLYIEK
jgi:hypothetical protein